MPTETPSTCEALLRRMVGHNTVNAQLPDGKPDAEQALGEYLEALAKQWGLASSRHPVPKTAFNLLITCEVSPDAPWLLMDSHMDTVSARGMIVDPFAGEVRDGRMYGRGACDTKGSGAAMLWALRDYAAGSDRPNNVAICFGVDEEVSKAGVRAFVNDQLPGLGWRPVGVIVGEPTMLEPVVAHNGGVRSRLRTDGVACHSSDPSKGKSAISMMLKVIHALESGYIPSLNTRHPLTGKNQASVNTIAGGVQHNIIPERCEAVMDRRIVPGEDPNRVLDDVHALLDELRAADPELRVKIETFFSDPALDPTVSEAFTARVTPVLAAMGIDPTPTGVPYGTNGSTYTDAGHPVVVIGPGHIDQAHKADEWLELDQLNRAVDVYKNLMGLKTNV